MNTQRLFFGVLVAILLVVSASAAPINGTETNVTIGYSPTNVVTTLMTSIVTSNAQTTAAFTTARATSDQPNTSGAMTTAFTTAYAPSTTTTKTAPTTTKAPGRKFDGLSFLGGMILAVGLSGIIFLVVSYLRRGNRLPYSNLQ